MRGGEVCISYPISTDEVLLIEGEKIGYFTIFCQYLFILATTNWNDDLIVTLCLLMVFYVFIKLARYPLY